MIILDTNVISELRQGKAQPSAAVRQWAAQQAPATVFLTAIAVLELERGVQALQQRTPPQGAALRRWLDDTKAAFTNRVLPFTNISAAICAGLHIPDPRPERDAMMAAIALEHGFALATRNVKDFAKMGVRLVNPWEEDTNEPIQP